VHPNALFPTKRAPHTSFVAVLTVEEAASEPAPAVPPVSEGAAVNQRKKDAVQQLAALADALDDIEA